MRIDARALAHWTRSQQGRRKLRYSAASVTSALVGQVILAMAFGGFRLSARSANLFAWCLASLTSYHLTRVWVWGRGGRSDLLREVLPFWVLAVTGLAVSTLSVVLAENRTARMTTSHGVRTTVVMGASLLSVAGVWVVKYLVLDRYVFSRTAPPGSSPLSSAAQPGELPMSPDRQ